MTLQAEPTHMDRKPMPVPTRLSHATPVMWAMIGIPLATIAASAVTIFLAVDGAEPPLPPQYVSEGKALDTDLALGKAAARAGVNITLTLEPEGRIEAQLRTQDGAVPPTLRLRLTHATLSKLDRDLRLREFAPGRYATDTAPINDGNWLVQIDAESQWRLRSRITTPATGVAIGY